MPVDKNVQEHFRLEKRTFVGLACVSSASYPYVLLTCWPQAVAYNEAVIKE